MQPFWPNSCVLFTKFSVRNVNNCGKMFGRQILLCKRSMATKLTPHQEAMMARSLPKKASLPGVKHILVVASGKGGVGKSTVSANLAASFANMGKTVGLLDADIFGPSIPLMMNINEEPFVNDKNQMIPPINYGVKCLSMGLLTKPNDAIIWRGPLVMSALQRLLKGALWQPLDILVVDTPPGTGDVHLSLTQNVPIAGVLLVSTPQIAALDVTLRGAQMYRQFGVPILGLVENMGHAICGNCHSRVEIFKNKTEEFIERMNTTILAKLPIDANITECCDIGVPGVVKYPDTEYAKSFENMAKTILEELEKIREGAMDEKKGAST